MVDKFKQAKRKNRTGFGKTEKLEEGKLKSRVAVEEEVKNEVHKRKARRLLFEPNLETWVPKTELGRRVKSGEVKSLEEIFDKNLKIMEPEIFDFFIKDIREKLVDTTKTSYVRMSGRKYGYRCAVLISDGNKYLGFALGKDKDKWVSASKAARNARLALTRIKKGCGSWECLCGTEHSVAFQTVGKTGSVKVILMPAPLGTGLVVSNSIKPVLEFVGIRDVWSRTSGKTSTIINIVAATIDALKNTYLQSSKFSKNLEKENKEN